MPNIYYIWSLAVYALFDIFYTVYKFKYQDSEKSVWPNQVCIHNPYILDIYVDIVLKPRPQLPYNIVIFYMSHHVIQDTCTKWHQSLTSAHLLTVYSTALQTSYTIKRPINMLITLAYAKRSGWECTSMSQTNLRILCL